jgi:VCBS repeat-containing protein
MAKRTAGNNGTESLQAAPSESRVNSVDAASRAALSGERGFNHNVSVANANAGAQMLDLDQDSNGDAGEESTENGGSFIVAQAAQLPGTPGTQVAAAAGVKMIGTVTSVVGEAKATAPDGTVRILKVGDPVFSNETLTTSAGGAINIALENGKTLECGGDTDLVLNESILAVGAAPAAPGTDVAALQAAIAAGADPTKIAEATAAGGAPAAGGVGDGGSHEPVVLEQANAAAVVSAGFLTEGAGIEFGAPEFPLFPIVPPTASVTPGEGFTLTPAGAVVIEGTNGTKSVTFIISLDNASTSDVQVTWVLEPPAADGHGPDIDPVLTGVATVPAGQTEVRVDVVIIEDHFVEQDEVFVLRLIDAVNADINPAQSSATATIVNDDINPDAQSDTNWAQQDVALTASGNVLEDDDHAGAPSGSFADVADQDTDALSVTTAGTFEGTYGTLVLHEDGSYTYTLNNQNADVRALDNGETLKDSFSYTVSDGFNTPDSATLTVTSAITCQSC